MPFTPFHLGPGALFKTVGTRNFSFLVFGFSQVLMDLEPLIRIYLHTPILHGFTHTMLGATLIAIPSVLIGKPACELGLRVSRALASEPDRRVIPETISWRAACIAGVVGTYSHVLIDAVMHADVRPWWPWSQSNPLLGVVDLTPLHVLCVVLAIPGVVYGWIAYRRRSKAAA